MGYSHYYYQTRSMTAEEFEGFAADVAELARAAKDVGGSKAFEERYGRGQGWASGAGGSMEVEPQGPGVDAVGFNGANDAGCEAFFAPRDIRGHAAPYEIECVDKDGERFHCVKTRQRPYDAVVCAALLCLVDRAPDAWRVSSDGGIEDWASAARFAGFVLGRPMPLAGVSKFGEHPEALEEALAPTAWMRAAKELHQIEKAANEACEPRPRRAL